MTQPPADGPPPPVVREDSASGWHPLYGRVGPFYDSSGVMHRLRVDKTTLAVRRDEGALLAMCTGSGEWLYPAWQFTAEGPVHVQLAPVLAALRPLDGWSAGVWLVNEHPALHGRSPGHALAEGADPEAIARIAYNDVAALLG